MQFKTFTYIRVAGSEVKPKKLPRYPPDCLILLEITKQLEMAYNKVKAKRWKTWSWTISIGPCECKYKHDTITFGEEWEQYPLEDYPHARPMFDSGPGTSSH